MPWARLLKPQEEAQVAVPAQGCDLEETKHKNERVLSA
jgi:hypothetical protein